MPDKVAEEIKTVEVVKKYLLDALNKIKEFTNNKLQNTLGFLTLILMTVAAVALLYIQVN